MQFSYYIHGEGSGSIEALYTHRLTKDVLWSAHGDQGNQWHTAYVNYYVNFATMVSESDIFKIDLDIYPNSMGILQ